MGTYDPTINDLPPDVKRLLIEVSRARRVPFIAVLDALAAGLSPAEIEALDTRDFGQFRGAAHPSQQQQAQERERVNRNRVVPAVDTSGNTAPTPRPPIRFGMSFPRGG